MHGLRHWHGRLDADLSLYLLEAAGDEREYGIAFHVGVRARLELISRAEQIAWNYIHCFTKKNAGL